MLKAIAIDPGMYKCGLVIADVLQKKVNKAEVIQSDYLLSYIKNLNQNKGKFQFLIGNGTTSTQYISALKEFIPNLIIAEEKNSSFRAKERYFEIFPIEGLKKIIPREVFILNKNLDALAALIILEDFYNYKFAFSEGISIKTWLK